MALYLDVSAKVIFHCLQTQKWGGWNWEMLMVHVCELLSIEMSQFKFPQLGLIPKEFKNLLAYKICFLYIWKMN